MKQMLMLAGAIACGFSAWATIPTCDWFSAVPGSLGGGTWSPAPSGTNTTGTAYWEVDTDGVDDSAIYTATAIEANGMTARVTTSLSFTSVYPTSAFPEPTDDAQAGLIVGLDGTDTNYYGLVAASGDTNYQWVKLTGVNPPDDLDTQVTVTICVNYSVSPVTVTYMIGDKELKDSTEATALTRRTSSATQVTKVSYAGYSKIQSIAGNVDAAASIVKGDPETETGYLNFAAAAAVNDGTIKLYKDATDAVISNAGTYTINKNNFDFSASAGATGFWKSTTSDQTVTCVLRTAQTYSAGAGSSENPYQIATLTDLQELAYWNSQTNVAAGTCYKQMNNIALDATWTGIGAFNAKDWISWSTNSTANNYVPVDTAIAYTNSYVKESFKGVYDGNNKTISNLILECGDYVGFFGSTYGATIKNVKISLGNTTGFDGNSGDYGGAAIVGVSTDTTIENCQTLKEGEFVGMTASKGLAGIVGYANSGTILKNCVNNLAITTANEKAGGLVACSQDGNVWMKTETVSGITIDGCTNNGNVVCTTSAKNRLGGLVSYTDCVNTFKGANVVKCTLTQNGGDGYSVISPNGGTVVLADDATFTVPAAYKTVCSGKAVDGLFFATVSDNTATLVKNSEVVAGYSYKIMADGAPNITLADPAQGATATLTLATNFYNYAGTVTGTLYEFKPSAGSEEKTADYTSQYKQNTLDVNVGDTTTGKIVVDNDTLKELNGGTMPDLSDDATKTKMQNKLNATGGNGAKVWESYAMGLESTNAVPKMAATQDTSTTDLTVSLAGVAAKAGSGVTLKYKLDNGEEQDSPTFTIPLNTSGSAQKISSLTVRVQPAETTAK